MALTPYFLNDSGLAGSAKLINATASGSADTIVTNPASFSTIITGITLHNTDTSAIIVTLCHVEDNSLAVGTDAVTDEFWQKSIAASDTVILGKEDTVMVMRDTNDTLQAYAGTADKVNIFVYGYQLSD